MSTNEPKYVPSEFDAKKIENGITYHPVTGESQMQRYADNRSAALAFSKVITGNCPPSRELSLAITNLQQSLMWASCAIAVNE